MKDFLQPILEFIKDIFSKLSLNAYEVGLIFVIIVFAVYVFDNIINRLATPFLRRFVQKSKIHWHKILFKNKIFNSTIHFVSILIAYFLLDFAIDDSNVKVQSYAFKALEILFSLVFLQFSFRLVDVFSEISSQEKSHKSVAIGALGGLIKVLSVILVTLIIISVLFSLNAATIITSLSALTAILLLVFRDPILGFVAGIQIATSKTFKIGDWIKLPKYEADGNVIDINLVSAKILNFDKTISNIPSYELISGEVLSYENMLQSNKRRIKRSIVFNIKSFKFCDEEMMNKFLKYELITDYILEKKNKIDFNNPDSLKRNQITNIGTFRKYVDRYLLRNENVSNEEIVMVRQLEPSPKGLPLEIYCFIRTSVWEDYENIQADIFDHLLTAANYFDLEITNINLEA